MIFNFLLTENHLSVNLINKLKKDLENFNLQLNNICDLSTMKLLWMERTKDFTVCFFNISKGLQLLITLEEWYQSSSSSRQNLGNQCFKVLNTRQWKTVMLERRETAKWVLLFLQLSAWKSFSDFSAEKLSPNETQQSCWTESREIEIQGS